MPVWRRRKGSNSNSSNDDSNVRSRFCQGRTEQDQIDGRVDMRTDDVAVDLVIDSLERATSLDRVRVPVDVSSLDLEQCEIVALEELYGREGGRGK